EIDKDLLKELVAARKKPRNFAYIPGKAPGLVLAKSKIGDSSLAKAKKEAGGNMVIRGRCCGEKGVIVFETAAKPPGGMRERLRAAIKAKTNKMFQIDVRQVDKVEEVEDETDDEVNDEELAEAGDDGPVEEEVDLDKELADTKPSVDLA